MYGQEFIIIFLTLSHIL